jgi:hypothetical protein
MAIGAIIVFALGVWIIGLMAIVAACFAIAYLFNVPFTVTEKGKKVGYFSCSTGFVRKE